MHALVGSSGPCGPIYISLAKVIPPDDEDGSGQRPLRGLPVSSTRRQRFSRIRSNAILVKRLENQDRSILRGTVFTAAALQKMNEGVPRSDLAPRRPPACTSGILAFSSAEPLPVASAAPPAASPEIVPICLLPSTHGTGSPVCPLVERGIEHGESEFAFYTPTGREECPHGSH